MPDLSNHALERSIRKMSYGGALALEKRQQMLGYDQLQELEHQFQIPVTGTADDTIVWRKTRLDFDVEFFFAPQQRDSPLTMPHFTYGAVISGETDDTENPDGAVGIFATVISWVRDGRNAIKGAHVAIGFYASNTVDFDGYVHLSFQGYGAVSEDNPDEDVGT